MKHLSILIVLLLLPLSAEARISRRDAVKAGEANKQETMQQHIDNAKNVLSTIVDIELRTHKVGEVGLQFSVPKEWQKTTPKRSGIFTLDSMRGSRTLSTLFKPSSLDEEKFEHTRIYFEKRALVNPALEPREMWYYMMSSNTTPSMNPGKAVDSRTVSINGRSATVETYTTGDDESQYKVLLVRIPVEIRDEYLLYLVASNYSYKQYEPVFNDIIDSVHFAEQVSQNSSSISNSGDFTDIRKDHPYKSAIAWGKSHKILQGYEDGSFGPDKTIKRAELLKIIVEAISGDTSAYVDETGFTDVDETAWYAPYLRYAKAIGIIQGYADGSFKPGSDVNAAEAMKMIYKTLQIQTDEEGGEWFARFFTHARGRKVLFSNELEPSAHITRKDVMWIVWKLRNMDMTTSTTQSSSTSSIALDTNWAYYQSFYDDLQRQFEFAQEDLDNAEQKYISAFQRYGFTVDSSRVQPYMASIERAQQILKELIEDKDWIQGRLLAAKGKGAFLEDKKQARALNKKYYAFSSRFEQFVRIMQVYDIAAFDRDYFLEDQYPLLANKSVADTSVEMLNQKLQEVLALAEGALQKVIVTADWPGYIQNLQREVDILVSNY